MKKMPEHIILDYSKSPNEFVCTICGERRPAYLPAAISDFAKQVEAFAESHKYCKTKKDSRIQGVEGSSEKDTNSIPPPPPPGPRIVKSRISNIEK